MDIQATDFLPYYDELKFGAHMAVALAAAFAGGFAMWFASMVLSTERFGFCESFAVSLFCASAIWIAPSGLPIPPLCEKILIAAFAVLPLFINRLAFGLDWKKSARIWAAFCLAQFAVFAVVYHYFIK